MIRTITLLIYGFALLFVALRSLRAQRLKERYVIVLILTGLPFLVLAVWPNGVSWLAGHMDMPYYTVLLLLLTGFLLVQLFELLSIISVHERRIATLAQTVGILMEGQKPELSAPGDTSSPAEGGSSAGGR